MKGSNTASAIAIAGFLILGATVAAAQVPNYVTAAERPASPVGTPVVAPDRWLLAFVDVETTGLVPGYHEMIDLGLVLTDLDGNVRDSLFIRVQPRHPERLSDGAKRVNGFDASRWRSLSALEPRRAVDSLVAFHTRNAGGKAVMLVAFNSQFDTAFLDHLLRESDRSWRELFHYFVLDVPSMAWSLGYRDLTNGALAQRLNVPDEPRVAVEHTGLTGAMLNVRIYRALRQAERK
jgi:DNA polymerase III alpha subunit (gram-positive type)